MNEELLREIIIQEVYETLLVGDYTVDHTKSELKNVASDIASNIISLYNIKSQKLVKSAKLSSEASYHEE